MQPLAIATSSALKQSVAFRRLPTGPMGAGSIVGNSMHRVTLTFVAGAALLLSAETAAPAGAGYGAIAYDQTSGSYGSSSNQPTAARANEEALKSCASSECRVHSVEPRGCGALAKSDSDKAWGGADRDTIEAAKRDAVEHCQTHTSTGHCKVVVTACNK